jgi:hypothetical protein
MRHAVDAEETSTEDASMQQARERPYGRLVRRSKKPTLRALRSAGFPFELIGHWIKNIECVLTIEVGMPGVYIWAIDGLAVYVGTGRSIGLRHQYHGRYPEKYRMLCHRELRKALTAGKRVAIYALNAPIAKWNGMSIPIRKSIEHLLLSEWVFAWNREGQGRA